MRNGFHALQLILFNSTPVAQPFALLSLKTSRGVSLARYKLGPTMPPHNATDSVKVCVRCRPLISKEKVERCRECIDIQDNKVVVIGKKSYSFDYALTPDETQRDTYSLLTPLLRRLLLGFNATVFAYGQTGSGKTYTMGMDSSENLQVENSDLEGILPRVFGWLFRQSSETHKISFAASFVEIYQEKVQNLLTMASQDDRGYMYDNKASEVVLRESPDGDIEMCGKQSVSVPIDNLSEMMEILEQGVLARTTGSHHLNDRSSRSHAIFTIHILQVPKEDNEDGKVLRSKLHMVDLAGSERSKRTGAVGVRMKESIFINQGLLTLGKVISALVAPHAHAGSHIPYRESKLTRLLQDSLGGNSHTLMIACVSPADSNFAESLNTLKYAAAARRIKNKPVQNVDVEATAMMRLATEIQAMHDLETIEEPQEEEEENSATRAPDVVELVNALSVSEATAVELSKQCYSLMTTTSAYRQAISDSLVKATQTLEGIKKLDSSESSLSARAEQVHLLTSALENIRSALLASLADSDTQVDEEPNIVVEDDLTIEEIDPKPKRAPAGVFFGEQAEDLLQVLEASGVVIEKPYTTEEIDKDDHLRGTDENGLIPPRVVRDGGDGGPKLLRLSHRPKTSGGRLGEQSDVSPIDELKTLRKELKEAVENRRIAEMERDVLSEQKQQLELEYTQAKRSMQSQLEDLSKNIVEREQLIQKHADIVEQVSGTAERQKQEIEQLRNSIRVHNKAIIKAASQLEHQDSLLQQKDRVSREAREALELQRIDFEQQLNTAKSQLNQAKKELDAIVEGGKKAQSSTDELETLRMELVTMEAEKEHLEQQVQEEHKREKFRIQKLSAALLRTEQDCKRSRQRVTRLKMENEQLAKDAVSGLRTSADLSVADPAIFRKVGRQLVSIVSAQETKAQLERSQVRQEEIAHLRGQIILALQRFRDREFSSKQALRTALEGQQKALADLVESGPVRSEERRMLERKISILDQKLNTRQFLDPKDRAEVASLLDRLDSLNAELEFVTSRVNRLGADFADNRGKTAEEEESLLKELLFDVPGESEFGFEMLSSVSSVSTLRALLMSAFSSIVSLWSSRRIARQQVAMLDVQLQERSNRSQQQYLAFETAQRKLQTHIAELHRQLTSVKAIGGGSVESDGSTAGTDSRPKMSKKADDLRLEKRLEEITAELEKVGKDAFYYKTICRELKHKLKESRQEIADQQNSVGDVYKENDALKTELANLRAYLRRQQTIKKPPTKTSTQPVVLRVTPELMAEQFEEVFVGERKPMQEPITRRSVEELRSSMQQPENTLNVTGGALFQEQLLAQDKLLSSVTFVEGGDAEESISRHRLSRDEREEQLMHTLPLADLDFSCRAATAPNQRLPQREEPEPTSHTARAAPVEQSQDSLLSFVTDDEEEEEEDERGDPKALSPATKATHDRFFEGL